MKASTWFNITGYTGNLTELVERYKKDLGLVAELGKSTWYYDQLITTHALLASKICTVPRESGLWKNRLPSIHKCRRKELKVPKLRTTI